MKKALQKEALKNRSNIKEIERELIKGTPYKRLANKYNTSISALSKYKNKYLAKKVNTFQVKRNLEDGDELLHLLEHYMRNVDKITEACIEQLTDPENPEKLFLGAAADEIQVSYIITDREGVDRKYKDTLQHLLDKLEHSPTRIEINTPDRVHTLLQASHAMNKHIHLFGSLKGMLGNVSINITNQPVFIELTQQIIQVLEPYPEARQTIADHIRTLALEDLTED